jgi:hypothetical protein
MLAADHAKRRMKRAQILERALARRKACDAALQLGDVAADLRITPPFAV